MSNSIHNQFTLLHEDEGNDIIFRFQEVLAEGIVRQFINFMRGCGHHDDNIYGAMAQVAEEYFECKENPLAVLPLQQDDLA